MTVDLNRRDIRQRGMVPPEKLADIEAMVVGVGAVGRQVALQLAAMGVPKLTLVDFDTVEVENLASQGFLECNLGMTKVDAVAGVAGDINSQIKIAARNQRFERSLELPAIVFCCVDGIDNRRFVWNVVKEDSLVELFVDSRMAAETARVIPVVRPYYNRDYYEGTLFPQSEAVPESCTAKTTIYCANISGGLMVAQMTRWMREFDLEKDIMLNIMTSELSVEE